MTDSFNQHPIGTGRYKFESWTPGQNIIVSKMKIIINMYLK